jgi:hypothetical protein
MSRVSAPKTFHSSTLIRVLSDLALVGAAEPGRAFAEKLGLWLRLNDAINLHAVHAAGPAMPPSIPRATEKVTLADEFTRLRAELVAAMAPVEAHASVDDWRRHYLVCQRALEQKIRPFRARVRDLLLRTSPRLAKLAALDAVLDAALAERERKLLATLPALLERRFELLRQTHQAALAETLPADEPAAEPGSETWLLAFGQELQALLLAEIDTRLEPTLGLIEACNLEMTRHP